MSDYKGLETLGAEVRIWFEGGHWFGSIPAWGLYMSHGDSPQEVVANLEDGIEEYREAAREAGIELADPCKPKDSGRIALRVDGTLHTWLKWEARVQEEFASRSPRKPAATQSLE